MLNDVMVTVSTVVLTNKQQSATWKLKKQIADLDIEAAKESIQWNLRHNIPVTFNFPVRLHLSMNVDSLKVKIDYSNIKSQTSIKLIKYYLNNNMEAFAKEWIKLHQ